METLLYREENHVGYITLNIPDKLNALRGEMKDELVDLLRKLRGDSNVRALVITGAGRSFCAGGDVSTMGDKQKNNEGRDRMRLCCDWCRELMRLEKPVIAAAIMGGGVWAVYGMMERILGGDQLGFLDNAVAVAVAIGVGVVLYLVLVLALRVISREDLELMPKGEKLAKILHIH